MNTSRVFKLNWRFDNSILISNITHLAKSIDIRLGELEKMLGIEYRLYFSHGENTNKAPQYRCGLEIVNSSM